MISNERLIAYLSNPEDRRNFEKASSYFERKYRNKFQRNLGIKYSDKKYFPYRTDIYGIFLSCFFEYITRNNAQVLRHIEDPEKLDAWIDITSRRYAEAIRKKVDLELGINTGTVPFDLVYGADRDDDGNFWLAEDMKAAQSDKATGEDDDTDETDDLGSITDILDDGGDEEWAERLLEQLLSMMNNQTYADYIRKVKIEGMSVEDLAELYGIAVPSMYTYIARAMTQLFETALPLIQKNSRYMFRKCGDQLEKDDEELLHKFFIEKKSIKALKIEYKMLETKMTDTLIKAYKRLMKKYVEYNNEISYENEENYLY